MPVLPQVVVVGQSPCGSAVLFGTDAHVPLPLAAHDWQVPQPALWQQTPSVQWPVPHSWSAVQAVPADSAKTQLPPRPVQ
jgi:hypothetical protein